MNLYRGYVKIIVCPRKWSKGFSTPWQVLKACCISFENKETIDISRHLGY